MRLDSVKNKIKKLEREFAAEVRERLISRRDLLHPDGKHYSLLRDMKSRMTLYIMKCNVGMIEENEDEENSVFGSSRTEFEKRLFRVPGVVEKRETILKDWRFKAIIILEENDIIVRKQIESVKGKPTHFLFNVDPKVFYARLPDGRRNPHFDPDVLIEDFTPVYSDGSLGNPDLYVVSDGSWTADPEA